MGRLLVSWWGVGRVGGEVGGEFVKTWRWG